MATLSFQAPATLVLLDQSQLPHRTEFVRLTSPDDVAEHIARMTVRGAPAIGLAAAYGMAFGALQGKDLNKTKALLDSARPTAVNLSWATAHMLQCAKFMTKEQLLQEAHDLARRDVEINTKMAQNGAALIPLSLSSSSAGKTVHVLTHCNTGALACAAVGTALGVIMARYKEKPNLFVWVDETRPRLQGSRLTAFELSQARIPYAIIADSAAASLMQAGKVDFVLFGADRIASNGDVVNKIGSYSLAVLAGHHSIPVYCVAPTSSIDLACPAGAAIKIEERDPEEILVFNGVRVAPQDASAYNPAFDMTPSSLLAGIVTENGVCSPPYSVSLARAVAGAPRSAAAAPAPSATTNPTTRTMATQAQAADSAFRPSTRVSAPSGGGWSSLSQAAEPSPVHISTRVTQQSGGGRSNLKLGDSDMVVHEPVKISTRVTQQSGGGRSSLQLGDPQETQLPKPALNPNRKGSSPSSNRSTSAIFG